MQRKFRDRLLKLADYLAKKVERKKFDLNVIVCNRNNDYSSAGPTYDPKKDLAPEENFCGTAACAIGYCPLVFPRSVRFLYKYGDFEVVSVDDEEIQNFTWAEQFFGLNNIETLYLFDPSAYPNDRKGVKSVSNRIKDFVDKNKKVKSLEGVNDVFDIRSTQEGVRG
jgi:hypothetical protein